MILFQSQFNEINPAWISMTREREPKQEESDIAVAKVRIKRVHRSITSSFIFGLSGVTLRSLGDAKIANRNIAIDKQRVKT